MLVLAYIIAYVGRINIGVAALQMNSAIGLTASKFGFGAAIFSLPFLLGEIPGNQATFAVILCTYLIGVLKDYTGSFYIGILPLVMVSLLFAVAVLAAGAPAKQSKVWS